MGTETIAMRAVTPIRSWALLGFCLCFCCAGSFAFTLANTLGSDLDITLPLTTASFWQFAHSQDFYRRTRQQSATVRQEVVDLSNWEQADGPILLVGADSQGYQGSQPDATAPPPPPPPPLAPPGARTGSPRAGRVFRRLSPSAGRQQPEPQAQRQPPPQEQPRRRLLQRKARLNYAISSPFGSSDATVVQEHTLQELELEPDQQRAGHGGKGPGKGIGVCYSERDCITGFPMVPGDLHVKTTFLVTPADGDPGRVRVRVGVVVNEIELPRRLQFLSERMSRIIGNGGRKQAEKWLAEMITARSLAATASAA
eukprot:g11017.t1